MRRSAVKLVCDAEGQRVAKGTITSWNCHMSSNGFIMIASYILGPGNEQLTELAWGGGVPRPAHTNVCAAGQLAATDDNSDPDDGGAVFSSSVVRSAGVPVGVTIDQLDTALTSAGQNTQLATPWCSDQVPPFDATLTGANEYGA